VRQICKHKRDFLVRNGLVAVATLVMSGVFSGMVDANGQSLPQRSGVLPETSSQVPHVQVGIEPVPEVNAELLRRVAELPLPASH
jgi:phospholipase/carboxylesterase